MDSLQAIKLENNAEGQLTPEGGDLKRRSSSRSIKRKRFDDEIVEYSLGFPPTPFGRAGRARTQSQSLPPQQSIEQVPTPPSTTSQTVATPPLTTVAQLQPQVIVPPAIIDKRKIARGSKKNKKSKGPHQITTKDLGRWKPIDDLALIIGVQQTNDLRMVHRGIKFSCKFTVQELQSRWYSLLYEEPISRIAVAAMRNLHPELVESVQSKALYTVQEEELLGTIKSVDNPTVETFQELLDKNAAIFYPARTAKALFNHWQLLKAYSLLPDQVIKPIGSEDCILSFSDAEENLHDSELTENKDELLEIELALADRKNKKQIRLIENELGRWAVLVDSLIGIGFTPEFDNHTLAVLRGRLVRYLMRSKEISFGRSVKDNNVDVDLTLEGPAYKVSRRQGLIRLRSNGDFFISNEGKRPLFVDGVPLLNGNKTKLNNNSVLEICGLRFTFLVNHSLINAIRHESATTSTLLN